MRHRWPPLLATGLVIIAGVILYLAYIAAATNVTVSASAACVDRDTGRYDVTAAAHNTYDQTLHVMVTNPNSPIALTLAPNQSWSFTFHVDHFQAWKVAFTTTDAVLVGQTVYNFTFEGVCGAPPPPPSTTSSTTCDRANPPRTDCGTIPPPTTAPIPPSVSVTPPPASAAPPTTGPPDTSTVPVTTVSGAAGHPTTIVHQLPVTGMGENVLVTLIVAGSACIIIGSCALMARSRSRD